MMKTLIKSLGIFLLLLIGSLSSGSIDETGVIASTKNTLSSQAPKLINITVPMKEDYTSIPDPSALPMPCLPSEYGISLPGGGWVSGTATHIGKVNMMESPYELTGCNFDPQTGELTVTCEGKITAANGDHYTYSGTLVSLITDGSLTGEIEITGGTGRFEDATGNITIVGNADFTTGELYWEGSGTITFQHGK